MKAPMVPSGGRNFPVSPFRRLVGDLMHFSQQVPSVTIERRMNLAVLAAAREACLPRPCWSAIFIKAYALVASRFPDLRRSYMSFPRPRLYEHPHSIATMNVLRQVGPEKMILYGHVPSPESCSLLEIDARIHSYQEKPLDQIPSFVNAMRLSRVPWPLRRWLWWAALNILGGQRSQHFGTFGITTVASQGAGVLHLIPLLTSTLHYGLFDAAGSLDMRLALDHRVLDGATAAQALLCLEGVLHEEILKELLTLGAGMQKEKQPSQIEKSPFSSRLDQGHSGQGPHVRDHVRTLFPGP